MPRTTATLVKEIMSDLRTPRGKTLDQYMGPFIIAANGLVTQACASVEDYSDEWLAEIERWLAAHFVRIDQAEIEFDKTDVLSTKFLMKNDLGLDQTRYGQQAKRLDWNGGLVALDLLAKNGAKRDGKVTWLGTEYEC